mgnify:CR=1 FL=1
MKTLNNLTVGESCLIDKINIKGSMHRRFLDIGLVENTYVECVGESPSADPKAYLIRGAVIAMNVNTGAILAMAVKGDFNPNDPFTLSSADNEKIEALTVDEEKQKLENELLNRQWRNKAVSDTYEPGSVFKLITAAAAIEENLINKNNTFFCNGHATVAGQHYNCHKKAGHGTQSLAMAVSNSCNPAFITIGQLVGVNTFSKYFEAFGFTEKTGVDLPGEANSTYHKKENMGPVELSSSSFGQTFNVTPMQMISAVSACVNGGYLVQPHLVAKMTDENGKVVKSATESYKRQVISKETSATLRTLMEAVVDGGGGKNAYVSGYRIGGKTGTSQKVSKILSTGETNLYISSFCGVAPMDDPEIAVLIILDEPHGDAYYGGTIAAPVGGQIMSEILPYLGYDPQFSDDELKNMAVRIPSVVGMTLSEAKSEIRKSDLTYKIVGEGSKVVKQFPTAVDSIYSDGLVVLYTEEEATTSKVTVPDFSKMSISAVNELADDYNLNVIFSGNINNQSGVFSYKQSIPVGTEVQPGTIITVYFRTAVSE